MKKKNTNKIIKFIFLIFLFSYAIIYFSELSGYYEYQNHKQVEMTNEQIKKFEEDISNGKEIDLTEYLVKSNNEYNNTLSKLTSKISDGISYIVKTGVDKSFNFLSKIVEEK